MTKASRFLGALGAAALTLGLSQAAPAQLALVVHDGTAGLETNVLANLTSKLGTAGYTVTPNVGVPAGSLASYKQVWDIRFNNTTPLTGSDISAYVTYMQGGGSLFVMGENTGFLTRDNSISALVSAAGGGGFTVTSPANAETVHPPFTGPNPLTTITFLAAAGIGPGSLGSGFPITTDAAGIAGSVGWGKGALLNAPAGALIVVFDVNFMDPGADANSQLFLANLIAFLNAPTPLAPAVSVVPTLSTWGLLLFGLALAAAGVVAARKLGAA